MVDYITVARKDFEMTTFNEQGEDSPMMFFGDEWKLVHQQERGFRVRWAVMIDQLKALSDADRLSQLRRMLDTEYTTVMDCLKSFSLSDRVLIFRFLEHWEHARDIETGIEGLEERLLMQEE
jgi:hypothetical protein